MTCRLRPALGLTLLLTLAGSVAAFAAGPLKGRTYEGRTQASGVSSEGLTQRLRVTGPITLRVSRSGGSVTVHFASSSPILYCNTSKPLYGQTTKPARISGSGTFRASVGERFAAGPGPPPIVQVVTGRFSGRTVKGTVRTEAGECGGTTSFTATAR
jgi:hypothetical protein